MNIGFYFVAVLAEPRGRGSSECWSGQADTRKSHWWQEGVVKATGRVTKRRTGWRWWTCSEGTFCLSVSVFVCLSLFLPVFQLGSVLFVAIFFKHCVTDSFKKNCPLETTIASVFRTSCLFMNCFEAIFVASYTQWLHGTGYIYQLRSVTEFFLFKLTFCRKWFRRVEHQETKKASPMTFKRKELLLNMNWNSGLVYQLFMLQ